MSKPPVSNHFPSCCLWSVQFFYPPSLANWYSPGLKYYWFWSLSCLWIQKSQPLLLENSALWQQWCRQLCHGEQRPVIESSCQWHYAGFYGVKIRFFWSLLLSLSLIFPLIHLSLANEDQKGEFPLEPLKRTWGEAVLLPVIVFDISSFFLF